MLDREIGLVDFNRQVAQRRAQQTSGGGGKSSPNTGVFWIGADGQVYVKGHKGTNAAGRADGNTASYWGSRGFTQIADPNAPAPTNRVTGSTVSGGGGGGYAPAPKQLDQAQIDSLMTLLGTFDRTRDITKQQAATRRDTFLREKEEEFKKEKGKYDGKKLSTLQDFGGAVNDTDINTRDTLENLVSSLSVMGLGGSRALTRQILDAANRSNRKANETQATNNRELDSAFNEYRGGYENDKRKIADQYGFEVGKADQDWARERQNTLYKIGDVYNQADRTAEREQYMRQGNDLAAVINNSAFMNPSYTGESRVMATPDLADYSQNIAQYNTTGIGGGEVTPAGNVANPSKLAVRAIAVNDKDLGVKKKTEGDLGYGV